jgi:hypothetical protein
MDVRPPRPIVRANYLSAVLTPITAIVAQAQKTLPQKRMSESATTRPLHRPRCFGVQTTPNSGSRSPTATYPQAGYSNRIRRARLAQAAARRYIYHTELFPDETIAPGIHSIGGLHAARSLGAHLGCGATGERGDS